MRKLVDDAQLSQNSNTSFRACGTKAPWPFAGKDVCCARRKGLRAGPILEAMADGGFEQELAVLVNDGKVTIDLSAATITSYSLISDINDVSGNLKCTSEYEAKGE